MVIKYFDCEIIYVSWACGIDPWYCNKGYFLQVNNVYHNVGVNIHGQKSCHIVIKYFGCEISYGFWTCSIDKPYWPMVL